MILQNLAYLSTLCSPGDFSAGGVAGVCRRRGSQGSLGKQRRGLSRSTATMHGSESGSVQKIPIQRRCERSRLETQLWAAVYDELLRNLASAEEVREPRAKGVTDGFGFADWAGEAAAKMGIGSVVVGVQRK